jgi:hypothetical protein
MSSNNRPTHTAYVVVDPPEGSDRNAKARSHDVGAVWTHRDGDGYRIDQPSAPYSGIGLTFTAPKVTLFSDNASDLGNYQPGSQDLTFNDLTSHSVTLTAGMSASFQGQQYDNDGTINIDNATLLVGNIGGRGMTFLHDSAGLLVSVFNAKDNTVSAGQKFMVEPGTGGIDPRGLNILTFQDPKDMRGLVDIVNDAPFAINLEADLTATSFSFKGNQLSLFNGNQVVDTLRLTDPSPFKVYAVPYYGVIATNQPPLVSGTLLPQHV